MGTAFPHKNIYGNGVLTRSRSTTPLVVDGIIIVNSCRVLRVDSADIIVLPFVKLLYECCIVQRAVVVHSDTR